MKAKVKLPSQSVVPKTYTYQSLETGKVYQAVLPDADSVDEYVIALESGYINIDSNGVIRVYQEFNGDDMTEELESNTFIPRPDLQITVTLSGA